MKKTKNFTFSRRKLIIGSSASLISSRLLAPTLFFLPSHAIQLKIGIAEYFDNSFFKKLVLDLARTFKENSSSVEISLTEDLKNADLILTSPSIHFGLSPKMAFISRSPGGLSPNDLIQWLQDPLAKEIWNSEYSRFNVKPFFIALGESSHLQPFSLPYLFSKNESIFQVGGQYKTNPHFISLQIQPVKLKHTYLEAREKLLCSKIITSNSVRKLLAKKYFKSESILLKTDGLNHSPQVFQISFNLNKWNSLNTKQQSDFEISLSQFSERNRDIIEQQQVSIDFLPKTSLSQEMSTVEKHLKLYKQSAVSTHFLNSNVESLDRYIKFRNIEQSISDTYLPLLAQRHNLNELLQKYSLYRSEALSQHASRLG